MTSIDIRFPVGRMVSGSCYDPQTKDATGQPLVFKTGAQKGQPRVKYDMGVAIAKKAGETHWSQTEWGAKIYQLAAAQMPAHYQRPDFAFKITDGDSQVPNKKGRKPCEREGYPGHWVVYFSNGSAPTIVNANGSQIIAEKYALKCGYYVEVLASIKVNSVDSNPGLYISQKYVALSGYGEEISFLPDPSTVGFGGSALPAGASTVPVGAPVAAVPPPVAVAPVPPVVPGVVPPPNYAVLGTTPPPPAAPVGPQPTPKAAGATVEQMLAWPGWTMETLIANGYIA
jgi:hypothetical protein